MPNQARMTRTLRLAREVLTELTTIELSAVRGGDYTIGDHCGPPFDTTILHERVTVGDHCAPWLSTTITTVIGQTR
jgi:hypothetical protein